MFRQLFLVALIVIQNDSLLILENKTTIKCVGKYTEQPISWDPPITKHSENVQSLIEDNNVWNGWELQRSTEGSLPPVTDKRWEDFRVDFRQYLNFTFHDAVYFYPHNTTKMTFYLTNQYGVPKKIQLTPQMKRFWTNYTILRNNGRIQFFENSVNATEVVDQKFNHVGVRSREKLYWTIPEYSVRMAYNSSDEPTFLTILPSGKSCLLIYAYMCYKCLLEVLVKIGNNTDIFLLNSTETINTLWQQQKIPIEPYEIAEVILQRNGNSIDKSQNFWAVDVRLCSELKGNIEIHTIKKSDSKLTNYRCCTMKQNVINTSVSPDLSKYQPFCSEPGKLGDECDINCEDILGPKYKFCEEFSICYNYGCTCAWGYTGPTCSETCISGTWGLSCQNVCARECPKCDKITGECVTNNSKSKFYVISIICIVVAVLAIAVGNVLFKRRSEGSANANERNTENITRNQAPLIERSEIVNNFLR